MKKITITLAALCCAVFLNAQVEIALKAGPNFSTARAYYNGVKQPVDLNFGYGFGAMMKVPFEGVLNFSPSATINRRGFIIKPLAGPNAKEKYGITYLDLVPALSADFRSGENKIMISLGPDFGFTNFGRVTTTTTNNVTTTQPLKFGYTSYGNFDIGINAGIGFRTKKMLVELNYMYGLASINNMEDTDMRNIRNRMVSLNLGYFIK